ncbi:unnamed protein product [Allacma fusca]|uniref:Tyrosine-protein phosphatase domain-containing protein n=1 Tax=Allacma fusca TaxID=39272 RepID=A0A8J2L031_9HEXA|nr:unnamed protein product [Allacma fusca]
MILVERWRVRHDNGPVVIVSHDGKSRVGIYCAAVSCIEQIRLHGEVDVFTTMRTLRRFRPRIMPYLTEYKYIYKIVLHYVLQCLRRRQKQKSKDEEE